MPPQVAVPMVIGLSGGVVLAIIALLFGKCWFIKSRRKALGYLAISFIGFVIAISMASCDNKNGSNGPSNKTLPKAPSNLTARAKSSSQIDLRWQDNADNEDGFKIERKAWFGGEWGEIKRVGSKTTTYSDAGLRPDTVYYYRVRAYNSAGYSSYSNEVSCLTPPLPPQPCGGKDYELLEGGTWTYDSYLEMASAKGELKVCQDTDYIQIEFQCLDAESKVVCSLFANQTNLKEEQIWKFEASGLCTGKPAKCSLVDVTMW